MSKIIKYGYIARTQRPQVPNGYIFPFEIPEKAWQIAEGMRYPEIFCIDPKRAESFLSVHGGVNALAGWPHVTRRTLFSREQWQEIIKSFNGHEPEIDILDPESMGQVFNRTPENLKIKLRVMLDENGNQIKEADLLKSDIITFRFGPQPYVDFELDYKKFIQEHHIKNTTRDQMIQRLVDNERSNVLAGVREYEQRIRQMTDEQIEKEYRMEFGE